MPEWERWPVIDTSTFFFRVPWEDVQHIALPAPLVAYRDGDSAEIEVGYVSFSGGPAGREAIGPAHELSWGLRVETEDNATFAFLQRNLSSDNPLFVADANDEGFCTPGETFRFTILEGGQLISVADQAGNRIVDLERTTFGEVPIPAFLAPMVLGESDVWTQQPGQPLMYRQFRWSGAARVKLLPQLPCTLHPHSFFDGINPKRVSPIPTQVFSACLENGTAEDSYQEFWRHPEQVG